jgi:hypothetical protein
MANQLSAYELADDAKNISNTIEALEFVQKAVPMLRQFGLAESIIKQQQLEIEALKAELRLIDELVTGKTNEQ